MLTGVTITGADDGVDPRDLQLLSGEFPFVEWGVLFSAKRTGEPRYPTRGWTTALATYVPAHLGRQRMRLAMHLCGESARVTCEGSAISLKGLFPAFRRIQVNGYAPPSPGLVILSREWTVFEFVLQVRDESQLEKAAADLLAMRRASILFDPSGGRGLEAPSWPSPPAGVANRVGYAGGINPSNVERVLGRLNERPGAYWIDMESGVRTGDRFDLALVRDVLVKCRPFIVGGPR